MALPWQSGEATANPRQCPCGSQRTTQTIREKEKCTTWPRYTIRKAKFVLMRSSVRRAASMLDTRPTTSKNACFSIWGRHQGGHNIRKCTRQQGEYSQFACTILLRPPWPPSARFGTSGREFWIPNKSLAMIVCGGGGSTELRLCGTRPEGGNEKRPTSVFAAKGNVRNQRWRTYRSRKLEEPCQPEQTPAERTWKGVLGRSHHWIWCHHLPQLGRDQTSGRGHCGRRGRLHGWRPRAGSARSVGRERSHNLSNKEKKT